MSDSETIRIDKWLWAVRLFKTRSLATSACRSGNVKTEGRSLKPAYSVRVNDVLKVRVNGIHRTIKVVGLLNSRVGAPLVDQYMEDQTPESELNRKPSIDDSGGFREKGSGRPTKRDRRNMDRFFG